MTAGQRWSKDKPTLPGWYWWQEDGRKPEIIHVVRCGEIIQQPLMANFTSGRRRYLSDLAGEWQGPITPDSFQQGRVAGLREACIAVSQFSSDGEPIDANELRIALVQLLGELAKQ